MPLPAPVTKATFSMGTFLSRSGILPQRLAKVWGLRGECVRVRTWIVVVGVAHRGRGVRSAVRGVGRGSRLQRPPWARGPALCRRHDDGGDRFRAGAGRP